MRFFISNIFKNRYEKQIRFWFGNLDTAFCLTFQKIADITDWVMRFAVEISVEKLLHRQLSNKKFLSNGYFFCQERANIDNLFQNAENQSIALWETVFGDEIRVEHRSLGKKY